MIPATYEGEIIRNGMLFMRTITSAYGAEEGMKLWDTIASTLDPDIKGKIFIAMLTGEYGVQVTAKISIHYHPNIRVEGIKAIRSLTNWGLKEAKDAHDEMILGKIVTLPLRDPSKVSWAIHELSKVGIEAR